MDNFLVHLCILCVSIVLIFAFFTRRKLSAQETNLPPGRTGLPFIGEMWDFVMANQRGAPEKFINDRTSKYSKDVFKTRLLGEDMAVFCGPAGNKILFSNEDKYVISWWPSSAMKLLAHADVVHNSPEITNKFRESLLEYLKPEAIRRYIPIMDSLAKTRVQEDWCPHIDDDQKIIKVFPLSKVYTFELTCSLFMDVKDPRRITKLKENVTALAAGIISMPLNLPGTDFNLAKRANRNVGEELVEIIKERKGSVKKNTGAIDMLTCRLQEQKNGDDNDVKDSDISQAIKTLLIASFDTVNSAITFILYYLEKNPHVYQKVYQEQMEIANSKGEGELLSWDDLKKMMYTWWVACETLRLLPPGGTFREVIADFKFAGYTIPKGWKAFWTTNSTHKDPKYFPDPEKFDPLRFEGSGPAPYTYVPFGGGPRMCPGREYARTAILVFIHNVIIKLKVKMVNPDEKVMFSPSPMPVDGLLAKLISIPE